MNESLFKDINARVVVTETTALQGVVVVEQSADAEAICILRLEIRDGGV